MKKFLLSATVLSLTVGVSAQSIDDESVNHPLDHAIFQSGGVAEQVPGAVRAGGGSSSIQFWGDTIFVETWSNGFNGDPGNGAWTAGTNTWEYRGPSTTPDVTQGSQGAFGGAQPIQSPTTSNGFVIFDSDYLDNGGAGQSGFGTGSNPAIPGGHDGVLESPTFNLSAYNNVFIDMHSVFRRLLSTAHVVFSTDNGATWTDTLTVFGDDHPVNAGAQDQPPLLNPIRTTVPLPCGVAGNSQVKMRLYFDGTECNANGLCAYYYWMVDDIYLLEAPDYDLSMDQEWYGSPDLLTARTSTKYYGQIPSNQAAQDTVRVSGQISNKGSSAQANTRMEVYVNGTLEETSNSELLPAVCGSNDSLFVSNFLDLDRSPGRYKIDFVSTSDNPNNLLEDDTITHILDITDTAYSWVRRDNVIDNGTAFTTLSSYEIASEIVIHQDDTATGFDFFVSEFNNDDPSIILKLYELDNQGNITPLIQEFTSLNDNLGGNWVNFPIQPTALPAGKYLLGWEAVGDTIRWATDGTQGHNRGVLINTTGQWQFFADEVNFRAPAIQLNVAGTDCPVITGEVISTTDAGCGLSNGSAEVAADDPNNSILWPDNTTGPTNNNLAAGVYQVSLIDDNNCVGEVEVIIDNANAPERVGSGLNVAQEISCNFANDPDGSLSSDGILEPDFTGGTAPYSFVWPSGDTTQSNMNNGRLEGLGAGSYRVTVIDDANCEAFSQGFITLLPPQQMEIEANHTTSNPFGSVTASVTAGGEAPFTYTWNTGETTETIDSDEPEPFTYEVTVTDVNGCEAEDDVTPTGTGDLEMVEGINVYPNPNSGRFNVEFTNLNDEFTLVLRNMVGQIVSQERVNVNGTNTRVMELGNLSSGVYLLEVKSSKEQRAVFQVSIK